MRKLFVFFCAVACAWALVHPEPAQAKTETVEANLPLAKDGAIEVDLINGSLIIEGHNGTDVEMEAKVKGGLDTFLYESDGKTATFKQDPPKRKKLLGFMRNWEGSVDLVLSVPRNVRLDIDAVNMDVEGAELSGKVRADLVNGSIEIGPGCQSVKIETVNGKIRVTGVSGGADIETVNGRIELEDVSGEITAETVNGAIRVKGGSVSHARLTTLNGDIDWGCMPEAQAEISCETHGGSITVLVPESMASTIHAETFSGSISSDFTPSKNHRRSKDLTISVGSGSNAVEYRLSSFSGSIDVEKM